MLRDVTAEGVRSAIEEFDRVGRDAFLAKYGFRPSRAYVLVHDGKRYDSKAICGAAHGYDLPEEGPLTWDVFTGGAATVQRRLGQLGFQVVTTEPAASTWAPEERILALDLYLRQGLLDDSAPKVMALSAELRAGAFHPDAGTRADFRNPNGVALKLANFAAIDPGYPGTGMPAFSIGDEQTWEEYAGDADLLAEAVAAIRVGTRAPGLPQELDSDRAPIRRPVEEQHTGTYVAGATEATTATRAEADLVLRFADWLRASGAEVSSHHYPATRPPLRNDLADDTGRRLWEAKASVSRSDIRMAVGQLLDYQRLEREDGWSLGVLLPREPSADLAAFLATIPAAIARPSEETGFTITEA